MLSTTCQFVLEIHFTIGIISGQKHLQYSERVPVQLQTTIFCIVHVSFAKLYYISFCKLVFVPIPNCDV
jgi:hypothetical protein